jgi:hypothetical protein
MSGAIHLFPQYVFMAWCSVKAQGQLYFYLYLYLFCSLLKYPVVPILSLFSRVRVVGVRFRVISAVSR